MQHCLSVQCSEAGQQCPHTLELAVAAAACGLCQREEHLAITFFFSHYSSVPSAAIMNDTAQETTAVMATLVEHEADLWLDSWKCVFVTAGGGTLARFMELCICDRKRWISG